MNLFRKTFHRNSVVVTHTWSIYTILILFLLLFLFRINHVSPHEISWDVLGYYLYLPSTFIHHDPMLTNIDWLTSLNEDHQLTGTFYQISSNQYGEPMYFFFMGMSFFYLPFFLVAHGVSWMIGSAQDGFSIIYQYSLVCGGLIYTLIGLIFLRKILIEFFTDKSSAFVIIVIVLGTNYIHHLTLDNLATVNVLFMLMSILCYNTIQWHKTSKNYNLIAISLSVFLMGLVKPSEIIAGVIPILWNIHSRESLQIKISLIKINWKAILFSIFLGILLFIPQIAYWHAKTGKWIYDSYKNPGVGLDLLTPHVFETLFSYRKGWFVYTPVMILALLGFPMIYKQNRSIFLSASIYFLLSFYIISSWSEWWYGAAYSIRPLITTYPILAIGLAYFIQYTIRLGWLFKSLILTFIVVCIGLNQFQWWQFRHYILDPYRTNKAYYWTIFGKTYKEPEWESLKMVERDFTGAFNFKNREQYLHKVLDNWTFEEEHDDRIIRDDSTNYVYEGKPDEEFSKTHEFKFHQLSSKDHVWIVPSVDIRYPKIVSTNYPMLVLSIQYKKGIYAYHAIELKPDSNSTHWKHFTTEFLTPEIRSKQDIFKCYIWNPHHTYYQMDNFKLDQFEPHEF